MSPTKGEYLHVKYYHAKHASKQDIEEIIECCKSIFNSVVHEDFLNSQNLQVEFFNAKMASLHMNGFVISISHRMWQNIMTTILKLDIWIHSWRRLLLMVTFTEFYAL